ncbi:flavin reductase (DIM6/NTAB) family NADH-FMN oxidoreductase RutF [Chitinophaga skermanii]|uniref:Flavin reductase (DIM6/NTAB) family NADH-FMN oxidoreductase RutF n=1 Tax=Chitinophaga skermanii TaxID=331697 RepID=A0A327QLX4_9BACT|nr:flavin reductase family protein [Chitinophaga skermanii]RAJ05018.1 flavin reductase (DIM6/NTAB) family NADH-FMN oxidoreductase RutF [Chitinophaga skermanii]
MSTSYRKTSFPVSDVRRFLEPGPIVLVSSCYKDQRNIMTMGWYTVMEFTPSLIGCMITASNHSFELIKKSKACVINIPTYDLIDTVIGIGNTSGATIDKFEAFGLTPGKSLQVKAPLIKECYANFECKVVDTKLLNKYNFFILEVVEAHVAKTPKYPETVHYRGDGVFMVSGKNINKRKLFKKSML